MFGFHGLSLRDAFRAVAGSFYLYIHGFGLCAVGDSFAFLIFFSLGIFQVPRVITR